MKILELAINTSYLFPEPVALVFFYFASVRLLDQEGNGRFGPDGIVVHRPLVLPQFAVVDFQLWLFSDRRMLYAVIQSIPACFLLLVVLPQFLLGNVVGNQSQAFVLVVELVQVQLWLLPTQDDFWFVLRAPVDQDEVESHAHDAVDDLNYYHDVRQNLVRLVVVNGVLIVQLVFVLVNPVEVAVKDLSHGSGSVDVRTVPVEPVLFGR